MAELHFDLAHIRCPRCAGELVVRVGIEETGEEVRLTIDSACVACGVAPWPESDERLLVFRPGSLTGAPPPGEELAPRLAAAQARIDQLQRRVEGLDHDLQASRRDLSRALDDGRRRQGDVVTTLRGEISRLEGALADARAEVRRAEEATRGSVEAGKRAIEIE